MNPIEIILQLSPIILTYTTNNDDNNNSKSNNIPNSKLKKLSIYHNHYLIKYTSYLKIIKIKPYIRNKSIIYNTNNHKILILVYLLTKIML